MTGELFIPFILFLIIVYNLIFKIADPPMKPSLSFNPSQPLLEGRDVYVLCNAIEGNPHITSYTWTLNDKIVATTNNTLKFININRDINQQSLKCRVRNKFTEYKNQVIESNTDQFNIYCEYTSYIIHVKSI